MARHRTHSIEFKRQVVQEFLAGESPHALADPLTDRIESMRKAPGEPLDRGLSAFPGYWGERGNAASHNKSRTTHSKGAQNRNCAPFPASPLVPPGSAIA